MAASWRSTAPSPDVVAISTTKQFVEAITLPEFAGDALTCQREEERACRPRAARKPAGGEVEYRSVEGGLLTQDSDAAAEDPATLRFHEAPRPARKSSPSCCSREGVSIKSNAIAITKVPPRPSRRAAASRIM